MQKGGLTTRQNSFWQRSTWHGIDIPSMLPILIKGPQDREHPANASGKTPVSPSSTREGLLPGLCTVVGTEPWGERQQGLFVGHLIALQAGKGTGNRVADQAHLSPRGPVLRSTG